MKRILYFLYYLKKLDWPAFKAYRAHAKSIGHDITWTKILKDSLKYNISILEFFQFGFYKADPKEKENFARTGFMYEYQLTMNPKAARRVLEDKIQFHQEYRSFIRNRYLGNEELKSIELVNSFLNSNEKVVFKNSYGQCGEGIEVIATKDLDFDRVIQKLAESENDYIEGYIQQHDSLNQLSPSGLNTVRIITQLDKLDNVHVLGARLRITINSTVDNLAAGNLAAPIELNSGKIVDSGVYSNITKEEESLHPVTGMKIIGFEIPYWVETLDLVKKAAQHNTFNRSIGWDVAITNDGPELLEGNHDWCKLLWQLPVRKGLKQELIPYLKELN